MACRVEEDALEADTKMVKCERGSAVEGYCRQAWLPDGEERRVVIRTVLVNRHKGPW